MKRRDIIGEYQNEICPTLVDKKSKKGGKGFLGTTGQGKDQIERQCRLLCGSGDAGRWKKCLNYCRTEIDLSVETSGQKTSVVCEHEIEPELRTVIHSVGVT